MKDRLEVDDVTYAGIFQEQVAQYLRQGIIMPIANQMARDIMDSIYIMRSTAMQNECQHDYYDERQGDWTR